MLHDAIAGLADWSQIIAAYMPWLGLFVVTAALIWSRIGIGRRIGVIESRLNKMEKEVNILQMQASRNLMMELNAKPKGEPSNVNPDKTSKVAGSGQDLPAAAEATASLRS